MTWQYGTRAGPVQSSCCGSCTQSASVHVNVCHSPRCTISDLTALCRCYAMQKPRNFLGAEVGCLKHKCSGITTSCFLPAVFHQHSKRTIFSLSRHIPLHEVSEQTPQGIGNTWTSMNANAARFMTKCMPSGTRDCKSSPSVHCVNTAVQANVAVR